MLVLGSKERQKEIRLTEVDLGTFRSLGRLASDLGFTEEEEFIRYLSNKRILDLGSGYNGLAFGCLAKGIPAEVHSVTLSLNRPHFKRNILAILRKETDYQDISEPKAAEIVREILKRTYSAFAHNLSQFPNSYFDLIIDNAAVFWYTKYDEEEILEKSFREELRVLRSGGLIRIGDCFTGGKAPAWKEELIRREMVKYRVINLPNTGGFEVEKP